MHLMYYTNDAGQRVYTLNKIADNRVTKSAHPARFSPDDKYSRQRVTLKKRYGLLMSQQSKLYPFVITASKLHPSKETEDRTTKREQGFGSCISR